MSRESRISVTRTVQTRVDAAGHLNSPGDAVLIERGGPRWLIMLCPCGCGDEIPINLDSRTGPAWRLYRDSKRGISLYPSVWRDTGCESHFIVWRGRIYLFGGRDHGLWSRTIDEINSSLLDEVRNRLPRRGLVSYVDIADSLGEIPWEVLNACRRLVHNGEASEGKGPERGKFGKIAEFGSGADSGQLHNK